MSTATHLLQIAIELLRRPGPSGGEGPVRQYVTSFLKAQGFTVESDRAGNVLATRGTPAHGEGYPLLSFHMDMVSHGSSTPFTTQRHRHKTVQPPTVLLPLSAIIIEDGRLHTGGTRVLGGDDRCGGAIALTLARQTRLPLKIVASVEEEIGCLGIDAVDPRFFEDVCYALVLDRRGAGDVITSICGMSLCDEAFANAIIEAATSIGHPARSQQGTLSDALTLSFFIRNVVNLSVGYYNPHTVNEYIVCADLLRSFAWVRHALTTLSTRLVRSHRPQSRAPMHVSRLWSLESEMGRVDDAERSWQEEWERGMHQEAGQDDSQF